MKVTNYICLVLCIAFSLTDTAFSADKPKLRQNMNLAEAREAIINSGWMVPDSNRSKCLSRSGMRDDSLDVGNCDGMFSDEFHLNFPEYEGGSHNGLTVWGVYRDGYGECLEVTSPFKVSARFCKIRRYITGHENPSRHVWSDPSEICREKPRHRHGTRFAGAVAQPRETGPVV